MFVVVGSVLFGNVCPENKNCSFQVVSVFPTERVDMLCDDMIWIKVVFRWSYGSSLNGKNGYEINDWLVFF